MERNGDLASIAPLKTLTRKSIRPARLFQTEEQKRTRDAEKEEEALTDIEEQPSSDPTHLAAPSTPTKVADSQTPATPPTTGRALRSTAKKAPADADQVSISAVEKGMAKKPKRASPFDSWMRVKAGASKVAAEPSKSRKRGSDAVEEGNAAASKKAKVD